MADVTFTVTAVLPTATSIVAHGYAGEAVVRGNAVYQDAADNEYKVADVTNAAKDAVVGFALASAADGQAMSVCTGGDLTADGLTAGTNYVLSATGKISPVADLLANDYVTYVGTATSTTNLRMPASGPVVSGVIL